MANVAILVSDTSGGAATNTKTALQNQGHTVTLVALSGATAQSLSGYDCIVCPRFTSSDLNTAASLLQQLIGQGKPVVLNPGNAGLPTTPQAQLSTLLHLTGNVTFWPATLNSTTVGEDSVKIEINQHPITKNFPLGNLVVYNYNTTYSDYSYQYVIAAGEPYVGTLLATGDPDVSQTAGLPCVIAIEKGTLDLQGNPVGARVVVSGVCYGNNTTYSTSGEQLLSRCVQWAMGKKVSTPAAGIHVSERPANTIVGPAHINPPKIGLAVSLQPSSLHAGAKSAQAQSVSIAISPLAPRLTNGQTVSAAPMQLSINAKPAITNQATRSPALELQMRPGNISAAMAIHPPVIALNLRPVAIAPHNIFVRPSTVEARIQINIQSSVRLKYKEELVIGDPIDIYFTKLINTQTSQADFQTGTATNVTITSSGDLQIAKGSDTVTEDFEDDQIQFTFSGDWMRSMTSPYSGGYCFKSKTITDGQSTSVETTVTLTQDGNVSFYYRVSSESGYDKFYFFVDGATKINGVSGSVPWTLYSQPLTAGTHTLKWVYTKDGSASAGEDSAYIDNLVVTGIPSAYKSSGSFTSAVLDISQSNYCPKGTVNWNTIVPQGTDVQVETNLSLDGGTTWLGFQPVTNGGHIPGITNQSDLTNARLQYRVTLSTTDGSVSPTFSDITFLFEELARSYAITSESQVNVKTFERITNVMDSESNIHLIMLERPQTDVAVDSMIHLKMFENMLSDFEMEDWIGILVFESFLTEIQSESDGYDHLIVRLIVISYALTVQQDISFLLFANEILDYTMYITDEIPIVLKVGGWNG